MKKIFTITLAAVCALSVAAFGFSACGETEKDSDVATAEKDSDVVTEDVWKAAMAEEKFYNVTVTATVSESAICTDSTGYTSAETENNTLTANIAYSSDGSAGSAYYYITSEYSDPGETDKSTTTAYEVLTADAFSIVIKETEEGAADDWGGMTVSSPSLLFTTFYSLYSNSIDNGGFGIVDLVNNYSKYEYADGAYQYDNSAAYNSDGDAEDMSSWLGYTFSDVVLITYVKINDGYVSSVVKEFSYKLNYTDGTVEEITNKYEYKFSGYGTTTVEVPEEYTFDYYYKHYVNLMV